MGEAAMVVSDVDNGLGKRLDEEINAFNVAVTGYADGRLLCIAVRDDEGDLRAGLYGWTWGGCDSFQAPGFYARFGYQECGRTPAYPHGYDDIHLVKRIS
jgi:hypothetical protein